MPGTMPGTPSSKVDASLPDATLSHNSEVCGRQYVSSPRSVQNTNGKIRFVRRQ